MLLGLVMLTAAWGVTQNGWVICYAWSLFIYGIGVGMDKSFHLPRIMLISLQEVNTP